jgi:hypothetical protein
MMKDENTYLKKFKILFDLVNIEVDYLKNCRGSIRKYTVKIMIENFKHPLLKFLNFEFM